MRTALVSLAVFTLAIAGRLAWAGPPAGGAEPPLDEQYQSAQVDVALATARLGLVQARMNVAQGKLDVARQQLAQVNQLLDGLARQTDVSAYQQVARKVALELTQRQTAQRLAETAGGEPAVPDEGYGNPKLVAPTQPGLVGQSRLAAEQTDLAREHALTNVAGSRTELATDPAVIAQRTLDHQQPWDMGRYAPAKELIDIGQMLELDRERVMYQWAIQTVADGARRDELLHVQEATIPPPHIMNYPSNWDEITEARKPYADGKLYESRAFTDTDGQTKTVVVYDVSDLLFVPIFPGPAEYNVLRPSDPLRFWTEQARLRDKYTHPPFSWYGPGYNEPLYGVPGGGSNGANPAYGGAGRLGMGGYYGYQVTDIIGSAYYYPYEADPIYQYRLAQKRARLLQLVNQALVLEQQQQRQQTQPAPQP